MTSTTTSSPRTPEDDALERERSGRPLAPEMPDAVPSAAPTALAPPSAPSPASAGPGAPSAGGFATAAVGDLLDGRWRERRRAARDLALDPDFQRLPDQTVAEHRERVLRQLHLLVERGDVHRGFPVEVGGGGDPGGNLAGFEELFLSDPSLQIKGGVQWGLFGSAIQHLGVPEQHRRWLPAAMSLEVPGCFAMTEVGHGSDVASIATTAVYDPDGEEFVIHTPHPAANKEYIGNAALHGMAAVVFAQLITQGRNHGVHAFYVPIRERTQDGELVFLPGVGGRDDGPKGGLNGIDNGQLWFDQVRVPRENLLRRYGEVAPDGTYSSPIASKGRRFFTMLGTLVQGRVSLGGAAVGVSKAALSIAVRYGDERRQFTGADERREVTLLDYQRHQRRLLPLVARTYAAAFAQQGLLERFHEVFSGEHDDDESRQDLETLAAALKPTTTWLALEALQESREACGGAGYMAENRLVTWRQDFDVYATFEGDNNVLLQLVGKRLLTDYGKSMAKIDIAGAARYVAARAGDMALHRTPLRRAAQSVHDSGSKARSAGHLRDPDVQRELLEDRVEAMVAQIAGALREVKHAPPEQAAAVFNEHQDELIAAARAHADLLQWEAFTAALPAVPEGTTRQVLTWLRDLYGLERIERHLAWYLVNGRLTAQRARVVTGYINRLLARLRPHAVDLVDAFGYTDEHLRAPIASGAERRRQEEAEAHLRRRRALPDRIDAAG
ncbi:acyl-CoA dehydrogenase [uncultured Georgenia sp.]|uniref:acyl-CoA dehydrogenase family protein n=1 Tax=uncultured Georgenia sp. TaxID=378209 RepID=UPI00261E0F01|nr:acyl-CoA dehydrogenase [uncultured Georgenia sp.]HLV03336.1 acyl-CoA dehydrogenase [Actinomycetaceae bacterium]